MWEQNLQTKDSRTKTSRPITDNDTAVENVGLRIPIAVMKTTMKHRLRQFLETPCTQEAGQQGSAVTQALTAALDIYKKAT